MLVLPCADLKRKWTNIRDYYRKVIQKERNTPTGSAAKRSKKYVYGDLLQFLNPVLSKKKESEGNYDNEEIVGSHTEPTGLSTCLPTPTPPPTPVPAPVVNAKNNKDVPTQILNMLQQRHNTSTTIPDDDDTKYLLSFRGYMKQINKDQKNDFKLGMLHLIKEINIRNNPPSSQSPAEFVGNTPTPSSPNFIYSPILVPQSSPLHYDVSSTSLPFVPPLKGNKYVPRPQGSPLYFMRSPSPLATLSSSSEQQNIPCPSNTGSPMYIIRSPSPSATISASREQQNIPYDSNKESKKPPVFIVKRPPPSPTLSTSSEQNKSKIIIHSVKNVASPIQRTEDKAAVQFFLQSQNTEAEGRSTFLKFK